MDEKIIEFIRGRLCSCGTGWRSIGSHSPTCRGNDAEYVAERMGDIVEAGMEKVQS